MVLSLCPPGLDTHMGHSLFLPHGAPEIGEERGLDEGWEEAGLGEQTWVSIATTSSPSAT